MIYPVYVSNGKSLDPGLLLPVSASAILLLLTGNTTVAGLILLATGLYYLFRWGGFT